MKQLLFFLCLFTGMFVLPVRNISACGVLFDPVSYLESLNLRIPYVNFAAELDTIAYLRKDWKMEFAKLAVGLSTMESEKADFKNRFNQLYPETPDNEKEIITKEYLEYAENVRKDSPATFQFPPEMDEFKLYLQGWRELYSPDRDFETPPSWEKLLSLPEEERHYRTVWVYHMLHDYPAVRAAFDSGKFADTAGLAKHSYLLEIRDSRNIANRFHAAYEAHIRNVNYDYFFWPKIMEAAISLPKDEFIKLLEDDLIREIIGAAIMSSGDAGYFKLSYHEFMPLIHFDGAERLAFAAYREGHFEEVETLLEHQNKKGLLYYWLKAKLARHAGDYESATEYLREWLELAKAVTSKSLEQKSIHFSGNTSYDAAVDFQADIYGELGAVLVHKKDFIEALHCFMLASSWYDAARIAEQFIDLDALKQYIDTFCKEETFPESDSFDDSISQLEYCKNNLRYLFARRAFREKQYDWAKEYMPSAYAMILNTYFRLLEDSRNTMFSSDERALALYNALKIMRIKGMELCGTELAPDYAIVHGKIGSFEEYKKCNNCTYVDTLKTYTLCPAHLNYAFEVTSLPRFHYRYIAAQMAIEAGELAEDRDLKALIHYFGGMCIAARAPKEADILYKRLVWKSWETPLAKLADQLRWFPTPYNAPYKKKPVRKFFYDITTPLGLSIISPPKYKPVYMNLHLLYYGETQNDKPLTSVWEAKELLKNALEK